MGFLKKKRSAKALAAAARRAHGSRDFAEEKRTAGRGQLQDLHGTSGARWAACVCVCVCDWLVGVRVHVQVRVRELLRPRCTPIYA